ncbi:hypothetical protein [Marinigracilibium pacificum]|uniref:Uncharacterized protein n=1 Tax=Marinigracilibium pacificum TaxID=2729599 RepID=A0A848J342_9BACT|nr:hypothetical protein [Marinigracilibium pacificum]NMM48950.1 hypothetical protein [Marinigracilibium pacificum]
MNISNNNQKLEDLSIYGLDWGVFLRHDMEGPISPFMYLEDSNGKKLTRMLMAEGNPVEFAQKVLEKEEKPFERFVIGYEGFLRDDNDSRVDAIIVEAYDVTQEKGIRLAQQFQPKENGGFKKIDKVNFLGNPDLILAKKSIESINYESEDIGFSGVSMQEKESQLTSFMGVFTHVNPSLIASGIKRYIRAKIADPKNIDFSGKFRVIITPVENMFMDFLKFLVRNSISEELNVDECLRWSESTGRIIEVECKYGEEELFTITSQNDLKQKSESEANDQSGNKEFGYKHLSNEDLDKEFARIISITNARANTDALMRMSELMKVNKERG